MYQRVVIASVAKQSRAECVVRSKLPRRPSDFAMTNSLKWPKQPCVYILTNARHTVLYTGVTSDLKARVYQHREKLPPGFTSRYNASELVYYEAAYDMSGAIGREKQIKSGSRQKKVELINAFNPTWRDLYDEI
jgi:putative endonuclease